MKLGKELKEIGFFDMTREQQDILYNIEKIVNRIFDEDLLRYHENEVGYGRKHLARRIAKVMVSEGFTHEDRFIVQRNMEEKRKRGPKGFQKKNRKTER